MRVVAAILALMPGAHILRETARRLAEDLQVG
jgi:hypothetical protein